MLGLWRQNSSKGGGGDDSSGMPRETSHGEEWQTSSQSTKAGALQVRDILRKNLQKQITINTKTQIDKKECLLGMAFQICNKYDFTIP